MEIVEGGGGGGPPISSSLNIFYFLFSTVFDIFFTFFVLFQALMLQNKYSNKNPLAATF